MRLHLVSDVHFNVAALARAGDGADAVVCLGDLILFVDYADPSRGIFADLFGAEASARFLRLRTQGRFDEARALSAELWSALGGDRWEHIEAAVRSQYEQLFAVLPEPAYLTYGNVDLPQLWADYLRPGHHVLDGTTVELAGLTVGFVGGGLRTPYRTPYELDDADYAAKVEALGRVDVLACHIPPALPELTYDVLARRFERGSEDTLALVRRDQPRFMLYGHVHQPLVARTRIGRTECVNVGHFNATGVPVAIDL